MHRTTSHTVLGTLTILLAGSLAGAGTPISETRPMSANGTVVIENIAGSVTVTGWDQNELRVTGELARTAKRLEIDGDERRLDLRVDQPGGQREHEPTTLEIMLPRGVDLEIETIAASIAVTGVEGRLELESVSGTVDVRGRPASLEAATVSGDITLEEAVRGIDLESVSGDILVERVSGEVDAESVSGSITIAGGVVEAADLESVSGRIRCEADPAPGADVDIETMSGSIVMVVPAGISADFELSSFSGGIDSAIGPKAKRTSQYAPGMEAVFSTGSGGSRIRLTTFSGGIELETR